MAETVGMCSNYQGGCSQFERPVPAVEGDTCSECGHHLLHESGLTWADARKAGYRSAFRVTVLPEAKPPENRSAKTHFHHGEVGKPGEVGGSHYAPEPAKRKKKARRSWRTRL